jgi:hypothetical protein
MRHTWIAASKDALPVPSCSHSFPPSCPPSLLPSLATCGDLSPHRVTHYHAFLDTLLVEQTENILGHVPGEGREGGREGGRSGQGRVWEGK